MALPPSYDSTIGKEQTFQSAFQQPTGITMTPFSTVSPNQGFQGSVMPPMSSFPQQPVGSGSSDIVMMGLQPYENVQTPNGVQLVRRTLGKSSSTLTCQFCKERVQTKVEETSVKEMLTTTEWRMAKCTWVFLIVLSPLWLFIPLCLYCCIQPFRMTKHTCPRCNVCIGVHQSGADQFFYTAGSLEAQHAAMAAMVRQARRR